MCTQRHLVGLLCLAALVPTGLARAQTVLSAEISPSGPIGIGDTFDVTISISGYSAGTEIDGWDIAVDYDDTLTTFVGPFDFGTTTAGPTQQWLAMASQESTINGYSPDSNSDASVAGHITASLTDLGFTLAERGTTASSGFLVSFTMQATAQGTATFTPAGPQGGGVLFDVDLNSISLTPDIVTDSITIVPEPRSAALATLVALFGWQLLLRARRPRS